MTAQVRPCLRGKKKNSAFKPMGNYEPQGTRGHLYTGACVRVFFFFSLLPGSTWQDKVADIRNQMQQHSKAPTAVLLSALDETACEWGSEYPGGPYPQFSKPPGPKAPSSWELCAHGHEGIGRDKGQECTSKPGIPKQAGANP